MNSEIKEFLELSEVHASVDYGNPSSVRAGNKAADSMRKIATGLVKSGLTEDLLELLDDKAAGAWVAFTVAELPQTTHKQRERCIKTIQGIAAGSGIDAMGAEMWLAERGYPLS